jgi:hypothetical protein
MLLPNSNHRSRLTALGIVIALHLSFVWWVSIATPKLPIQTTPSTTVWISFVLSPDDATAPQTATLAVTLGKSVAAPAAEALTELHITRVPIASNEVQVLQPPQTIANPVPSPPANFEAVQPTIATVFIPALLVDGWAPNDASRTDCLNKLSAAKAEEIEINCLKRTSIP